MNKPALKPAIIEQHTASDKSVVMYDLALLTKGTHVQVREDQDPETVTRYAAAYLEAENMPPVVVFEEKRKDADDRVWLADGHHRVAGAKKAKLAEINAIIKKGDRRAALLYALRANHQNGLPLTNADKHRSVSLMLADEEWRAWSDRSIAEACLVGANLVGKIRKLLPAEQQSTVRKSKDGATRDTKNIGKKAKTAIVFPFPRPPKLNADPIVTDSSELLDQLGTLNACMELSQNNKKPARVTPVFWDGVYCVVVASVHGPIPFGYSEIKMIPVIDDEAARSIRAQLADLDYADRDDGPRNHYLGRSVSGTGLGKNAALSSDDARITLVLKGSQRHLMQIDRGNRPSKSTETEPETLTIEDTTPQPTLSPVQNNKPKKENLDLRRLRKTRELLAERFLKDKPQCQAGDKQLVSLALVVGVPVSADAEPWSDALVSRCFSELADRLKIEVADRLTRNDAHRLPSIEHLAGWWGIDIRALTLQAERMVSA